jgi:2-oxoglutarate dehydrogenase E2 component (dihydrolipoamide succinyltransferase)
VYVHSHSLYDIHSYIHLAASKEEPAKQEEPAKETKKETETTAAPPKDTEDKSEPKDQQVDKAPPSPPKPSSQDKLADSPPILESGTGAPKKDAGKPAPAKENEKAPKPAEAPKAVAGSRGETRVKMNRMRLRIAERLKESQNAAASLTTFNEIDMSSLMEMRKKYKDEVLKTHDVKFGFMSAFARACCLALKEIPAANASIEVRRLVLTCFMHRMGAHGKSRARKSCTATTSTSASQSLRRRALSRRLCATQRA